jgi:16S rRNA (guanine527-N7)-methyltransferase
MRPEQRPPLALPSPAPLAPPPDFAERARALGAELDPSKLALLGDFLARLLAMNEQVNLTAIKDPAEAWERHALDALSLVPLLTDLAPGARLADIGSGGGLPGIPLAIARPDLKVVLVESTQKKAAFLAAVAEALGLGNVTVLAERAEKLLQGELFGAFDRVTARAVGRLSLLVPLTVPFLRPGGEALLVKGQRADEELAEAAHVLRKQRAVHVKTVATPTGRVVVLRRSGELPSRGRR